MQQTVSTRRIQGRESDISRHLYKRQQLIVVIMKLSRAIDEDHADLAEVHLSRFCSELVDYLSNAHFNLYHSAFPPPHRAPREYAILETTTRSAMAFDEHWSCGISSARIKHLKGALAEVTLCLETHFEMEDELIDLNLVERICA